MGVRKREKLWKGRGDLGKEGGYKERGWNMSIEFEH
jgi:hypothetical protein